MLNERIIYRDPEQKEIGAVITLDNHSEERSTTGKLNGRSFELMNEAHKEISTIKKIQNCFSKNL